MRASVHRLASVHRRNIVCTRVNIKRAAAFVYMCLRSTLRECAGTSVRGRVHEREELGAEGERRWELVRANVSGNAYRHLCGNVCEKRKRGI